MFTCISCRVAFETAAEQRSHFSTDWHRYNMKRRVANLPPVQAAAFNEKVVERREQNAVRLDPREMSCQICNKTFGSDNSYQSHLQSKKHRDTSLQSSARRSSKPKLKAVCRSDSDVEDDDMLSETLDSGSEDGIEDRLASARRRARPTDCLFCPVKTRSLPAALAHMRSEHSFYIPLQEKLQDLNGLLSYLGEKVFIGNLCLYCPNGGREFGSLDAVRRHMIDKSHCKLAFDSEADRIELSDFYASDLVADGTDSDWEDLEDHEDQIAAASSGFSLAPGGFSLTLPNGRTLGHRALKVYYRQKLRSSPLPSLTGQSEKAKGVKLLLSDTSKALVPTAGGAGSFGRGLEVVKARNAGEAKWAKKQGRSFNEIRKQEAHRTRVAFVHNSQKHFRDPLLQ